MGKGFKSIWGLVVIFFLVLNLSACGGKAGVVKSAEMVAAREAATSAIPVTTSLTADKSDDSFLEISPSFSSKLIVEKFGEPDKREDLLAVLF